MVSRQGVAVTPASGFAGPMDREGGRASPDDGQGVGIGDGMGHRKGPSGKGIDFEHAHGTVPENGLGILNRL